MSDVTKYKLVMDKQRDIRISDRQLPVAYTVLKNALHMHSVVIKNEQSQQTFKSHIIRQYQHAHNLNPYGS